MNLIEQLKFPLLLTVAITVVGCVHDASKRIDAFSESVKLTSENVGSAFDTAEKIHKEKQLSDIFNDCAINFVNCNPYNRITNMEAFMPSKSIEARLEVLRGLVEYSKKLSMIMGNSQLEEFDSKTKDFGNSLSKLSKDIQDQNIFGKTRLDSNELNVLATSVNALGRWFIDYKRGKEVKKILAEMQPHIDKITDLLTKDLTVLQDQIKTDYNELILNEDHFVIHSKGLNSVQIRDEVKNLYSLTVEQQQADENLKAVERSLKTMGETHNKIKECFEKDCADGKTRDVDLLIRDLLDEGKRINTFYNKLNEK